MFKRILTYSIIAVLAITLLGGTIAILVRPKDVEAYGGPGANKGNNLDRYEEFQGNVGGNTGGWNSDNSNGGQGKGNEGNNNSGTGRGQENENYVAPINWETITGVVLSSDSELTVNTGSTELLIGLGQSWYRENQRFVVNVGDEVRIKGYQEEGEFKAGTVENLTSGISIVLRDASGRPIWSGQNSLNSRGGGQSADTGATGGYRNTRGRGRFQENDAEDLTYTVTASGGVEIACPICETAADYDGILSEDEVSALYLALNDEYHAWAVYEQVVMDFGAVRPFVNIQNAEQNHISALTRLFETYTLSVPDNSWVGQVAGYESLAVACTAGVEAEIANGALYDTLFRSSDRADILEVFTSLQRASLDKHLPAFQRCAD